MIQKSHTVTAEEAGRIDRIAATVTGILRKNIRPLFDLKAVSVNGSPAEGPWVRVAEGDVVAVEWDPQAKLKSPIPQWRDPAFQVIFEDEHLIVVNKAAGVLTVPASEGQTNSLVHRVATYINRGRGERRWEKAHIVHRLDQSVSGLLVFGKTETIAKQIKDQFEQHKPLRRYLAIVVGKMPRKTGTFRSHLATDEKLNRYSTDDTERGELAITHYEVEQELPARRGNPPEPPATLVRLQLETGKRHQIRVHLAEAGHPILGDARYTPSQLRHPRWRSQRLALHAQTLGFDHPVSGEWLEFTTALPGVMARFIEGEVAGGIRPRPQSHPRNLRNPWTPRNPKNPRPSRNPPKRGNHPKATGPRNTRRRRNGQ